MTLIPSNNNLRCFMSCDKIKINAGQCSCNNRVIDSMDTGSYMNNRMENLIESGLQTQEELHNIQDKIESYIREHDYSWTFESILKEYGKFKNNTYVSHTAKKIINHFKTELESIYAG